MYDESDLSEGSDLSNLTKSMDAIVYFNSTHTSTSICRSGPTGRTRLTRRTLKKSLRHPRE